MESSTNERTSVQINLDWYASELPGWDFLLDYDDVTLESVCYLLLEDRIKNDKPSCFDGLFNAYSKVRYSRREKRHRVYSIGCLEQAGSSLSAGNYIDCIMLSVYSEMFNQSCEVEWVWDVFPLSHDTMMKQKMSNQREYIKGLCEECNG